MRQQGGHSVSNSTKNEARRIAIDMDMWEIQPGFRPRDGDVFYQAEIRTAS